jgi:hypothetical protein
MTRMRARRTKSFCVPKQKKANNFEQGSTNESWKNVRGVSQQNAPRSRLLSPSEAARRSRGKKKEVQNAVSHQSNTPADKWQYRCDAESQENSTAGFR